jgi:hypothetical protein
MNLPITQECTLEEDTGTLASLLSLSYLLGHHMIPFATDPKAMGPPKHGLKPPKL